MPSWIHLSKIRLIATIALLAFLNLMLFVSIPVFASTTVFKFDTIGMEQGLGNNYVLKVLQDQQGFIWVGTQNGLYRYDGYTFKAFIHDPDDAGSLAGNYIQNLYEDNSGTLWVVMPNNGVAQYHANSETFTNYRHDPKNLNSLSNNDVMAITGDHDSNLWIATLGGGLDVFDPISQTFRHFTHNPEDLNSLSDNQVYTVLIDSTDTLWAGTRNAGLNRMNRQTGQFERFRHDPKDPTSLSHDRVYKLLEDQKGNLWIGTRGGGLNRFNSQNNTFERFVNDPKQPASLNSKQVMSLFEDKVGNIWVGTIDGGLNRWIPGTQQFDHYLNSPQDKDSVGSDWIMSITQDQTGYIWLGTYGNGIDKFDPSVKRFGQVKHDSSLITTTSKVSPSLSQSPTLSQGRVHAVFKDSKGTIWIGTTNGLNRYDPGSDQFTHYFNDPANSQSLSDNNVWTVFEDSRGIVWVGTQNGGLNQFNQTTNTFSHYRYDVSKPNSLSDDFILIIDEDSLGNLWIGTMNGLNQFNRKKNKFTRYLHSSKDPTSISHNTVTSLFTSQDSRLWIGTRGGGLNQFNHSNQQFIHYLHDPDKANSLSNNNVFAINQDKRGYLWLATDGGLNQFNPLSHHFTHYRKKQGLTSDRVRGLLIDKNDKLWFADDSLHMLDPQTGSLTTEIAGQGRCGAAQGSYFQALDGQLFFGLDGYCSFYPGNIIRPTTPPSLVFTDFRLLNKSVKINNPKTPSPLTQVINRTQMLALSHEDNVLSFEFAALHFSAPKQNQYQYKLEGFNKDWIKTGSDNRRATYTNLPAGEYTFKVKASNYKGVWIDKARKIKLTINPAPWRTWWAYSIYALLCAALASFVIHTQRQKIRHEQALNYKLLQVDKLKDEFLANTSHELRTPLNGIIGLAESLMDGIAGQLPGKANHNLDMIVSSGKRLTNLVNDILDFSTLKNHNLIITARPVDLHSLVEVVLALSKPLVKDKNLELINAIPSGLPSALADEDRLLQIFHNLVGNAIKFTEQGAITVSAILDDDQLTINVNDTGIGIEKSQFSNMFNSFEQIQGDTQRSHSGTGLGLSVSRQLVALHGGTLSVDSQFGLGATFSFTLPVSEQRAPAHTATSHSVNRLHQFDNDQKITVKLTENASRWRILLVDDEPVNRQVLHNYLSLQNYSLIEASGGEEALKALKEDGPFDLILLDIMMPKISGYEICSKIRQTCPANDLPVIFLTAKNQVTDMVQSFAVGANDYLTKPINKHELLTRVETHLKFLDIHRNLEANVKARTAELRQSNRQINILSKVCAEISATLDIDELLDTVYQRIKVLMIVDVLNIGIYDPTNHRIVCKLAIEDGVRSPEFSYVMTEKNRPAVWCIEHQQPLIMNDVFSEYPARFGESPRATQGKVPGALMYWPMFAGDKMIGMLTVQSYQTNAYNQQQQNTIRTLAAATAIALDNAQAYREIELKKLEVEQKNREITTTQQQLAQSEKMAALGTLTAGVAHEINNPTNFVHVSTLSLKEDLNDFQQYLLTLAGDDAEKEVIQSFRQRFRSLDQHLVTIQTGTERIATIVKDLQAFTQLDSAELETIIITDLLQSTINLVQTQYQNTTDFISQFNASGQLSCYPVQLNQLFMHLIVNACDAIKNRQHPPPGRGEIDIKSQRDDKAIIITIKDNGCGMSEETKTQLFEPFYTTKTVGEGTGLGLSIAWGIVQKHGGELNVESRLGLGTTFVLRLPV